MKPTLEKTLDQPPEYTGWQPEQIDHNHWGYVHQGGEPRDDSIPASPGPWF
ncbi:MAG: hypothetical protein AB1641_17690 [Thermodesulfobacteriota bacterium]